MVTDFILADYSWLHSPDRTEEAHRLFKAGKNRDGCYANEEVIEHALTAIDILQKHYWSDRYVLIYNNALMHLKCNPTALSAKKMPKNTLLVGKNWKPEVNVLDEHGKPFYKPDGSCKKEPAEMTGGCLPNRELQSFYFGPDHPHAETFKGMAMILEERSITTKGLRAECKDFLLGCIAAAMTSMTVNCCCCRILFNQPDFISIRSCLQDKCGKRGVSVLILLRFHCELKFIEQCWGFAKCTYQTYPLGKNEDEMAKFVIWAFDSIPLITKQR